ncbi:hypothetical protein Lepto7376_3618 [[Leptolyngbya] sp. PCC 7376]|uniref:hypothetical protein n=1 Tax=[Leptolyngbya] sp. PCC 7376 TaxID=111781 RepID=UPI00029EC6E9|nr:hypothetical protein [[Leptolyngbya] sp. PCC 7376]AFY39798.1 hypothetical protein Lepto7376_3618 [[Leptolyngbya] sp. PCC 7376]
MKKKLGFLGSITIEQDGSKHFRLVYRPILLWLCSVFLSLVLGAPCVWAIINHSDFRIFASLSCMGFIFFAIDLLRHLGSIVTIDFSKSQGYFRYKKSLFGRRWQQTFSLNELVRVEAIASQNSSSKICLLLTTANPIYIDLFLRRSPHVIVNKINQFLNYS